MVTLVTILMGWCGSATGQVVGEFHIEKPVYAIREPVFVSFVEVNKGVKPEEVYSADPNGECSAFLVTVSNDKPRPACLVAISCLSGSIVLQPGQKHIERILLNLAHDLTLPGEYSITAERTGRLYSDRYADVVSERTTLLFQVEEREVQPEVLQFWVDQVKSHDLVKRFEAARVLASVAPPSLEDTLLGFPNDSDISQFSALAFHRLNSEKSMKAMVDLAKKSSFGGFENWQAKAYLAHDKCADANWSQ